MRDIETLRGAVLSKRTGTVCKALRKLIDARQFVLSDEEIASLAARNEPVIHGWLFAYKVTQLPRPDLVVILREGASSTEARVREQVCDLAGDLEIVELLPELAGLREDPISFVAQAAE